MPERLNGAVSKTVGHASGPRVRIPVSPPFFCKGTLRREPDIQSQFEMQI